MHDPRNSTRFKKRIINRWQRFLRTCLIITAFLITISIFGGCASQTAERSYKDYYMSQDLSLERGKQLTPQEVVYECSLIVNEVANLNKQLTDTAGSDSEKIRSKAYEDLAWFQRRANYIGCEHDSLKSRIEAIEEKHDTSKRPEEHYITSDQQPAPDTLKAGPQLTFDECFSKCRGLTNRTNEVCFDTCLKR